MGATVVVKPSLLKWARKRVDLGVVDLADALKVKKVSIVEQWELTGEIKLNQLEKVSRKTYTPIGYFFLDKPPKDDLPITDFRTVANQARRPSPNLLDTVYYSQFRQDWFRSALMRDDYERLDFIGSFTLSDDPLDVAHSIRNKLGLNNMSRTKISSYGDALRLLVEKIESAGILAMRNGVVGSNTHRKLNVEEFRGFALSDEYAPLIFINSTDAKSAQMFTFAHELAHIWLGQSGVSQYTIVSDSVVESFCNKVAAEVLIPIDEFQQSWRSDADILDEVKRLARFFKVSSLVVLIRAYSASYVSRSVFNNLYETEIAETFDHEATKSKGGDFYRTQGSRLSKRFMGAVIASTLEGHTTYTEAFQLLGIKQSRTFRKLTEFVFS